MDVDSSTKATLTPPRSVAIISFPVSPSLLSVSVSAIMYASAVVVSYDYNADANDCIDVGLCIGLKVAYWLWLTGQPSNVG